MHRRTNRNQAGELFLSIDLDAVDSRDSHDVLCVVRQNRVATTWVTKQVDHAWLPTVNETAAQEIGLRWSPARHANQLRRAQSNGLKVDSIVIDRIGRVATFQTESNIPGIWMECDQISDHFASSKVGQVGSGVCEFSISCLLPKMHSIWTDRDAKQIRTALSTGKRVHIRIKSDEVGSVATRLDKLLRAHSSSVKSISRAAAIAKNKSRTVGATQSILRAA